jgi:hypothetical protein
MYAASRFKQYDGIFSDAQIFMQDFQSMLNDFQATYQIPFMYRDDHITQQFTAPSTTTGTETFTITKPTYSYAYGDLTVYVNNIKTSNFTVYDDNTVQVTGLSANDSVTMLWEEHTDIVEPPYSWWGSW